MGHVRSPSSSLSLSPSSTPPPWHRAASSPLLGPSSSSELVRPNVADSPLLDAESPPLPELPAALSSLPLSELPSQLEQSDQ